MGIINERLGVSIVDLRAYSERSAQTVPHSAVRIRRGRRNRTEAPRQVFDLREDNLCAVSAKPLPPLLRGNWHRFQAGASRSSAGNPCILKRLPRARPADAVVDAHGVHLFAISHPAAIFRYEPSLSTMQLSPLLPSLGPSLEAGRWPWAALLLGRPIMSQNDFERLQHTT